jgi:hypothetical protein
VVPSTRNQLHRTALYDCPTSGGEGGARRGICQLHQR